MIDLHDERLEVASRLLLRSRARTVLDLGCGKGLLLQRLVREPQFDAIVGVDKCGMSLWQAQETLREYLHDPPGRLSIIAGSYTDRNPDLIGFDACAMVETIEHVEPGMLASVEQTVFGYYRPKMLVMTTPNADFNPNYGLAPRELRKADHCFEWDRAKFLAWTTGVAKRHGYTVRIGGIGEMDTLLGQPTQMALFSRSHSTSR